MNALNRVQSAKITKYKKDFAKRHIEAKMQFKIL